ncbi:cytomatrix protein-related [Euphorbia peplus]|nr:cytomatrix protein-related [Euphorbia peplus]
MGAKKSSQNDILFEGLVKLVKKQQQRLEDLLEERKILEDRIKTQQDRWVSDVRLCTDHIAQLKDSLTEKDMENSLLSAKSDLMVGLKRRDASILKLKLGKSEDELADFKVGFDYLTHILQKDKTDKEKEEGRQSNLKSKKLDSKIKRLKLEYAKLSSEKNSEVSALLKEKTFIWNQYNVLESDLTDKLKSKESEISRANDKIAEVLARAEQLQSSNDQKDEMIGSLRHKVTKLEVDRDKFKEEVSRLNKELKSMKESRNTQVTPVLRKHGDAEIKCLTQGAKSTLRNGSSITVKKEIPSRKSAVPLKDGEKGSRSLKRKVDEEVTILETPRLFSNTFKVPKLKTPVSVT